MSRPRSVSTCVIAASSRVLAVICLAASLLPAQTFWLKDGASPGNADPIYAPSPSYTVGAPGYTGTMFLPQAALLAPTTFPAGGVAVDQPGNLVLTTDGFQIAADFHGLYTPFSPGPPVPPLAPAPVLLSGGPLTGMGADPSAGILYVTDGSSYAACTLAFPYAIIGVPVPLPFGLPPGARLTGIDFEASTGTLWGVDAGGGVYNWLPFGAPIGPQPVALVSGTGLAMIGIAVNESNGPGALAPPFCSSQTIGYHVVVSDGYLIYDALNAFNPPLIAGTSSATQPDGLAYSADMQYLPGAGLAPVLVGWPGWQKPQNNGIGGANFLCLDAAQPLTTTLFLYDFCPIPGGLFIPASGETLWINPFSFTFNFATFVTDVAGDINQPVNLSFSLTGFTYTGQFAIYSPLSPLGYAFSDAMTFTIGLP
ncbi:MAG: hypothetical protein H6807_01005 [Planctomycetes bacterium]|nr:hypothetical protein [Planctomycetota bacterium]